jgi:hypothetical protein
MADRQLLENPTASGIPIYCAFDEVAGAADLYADFADAVEQAKGRVDDALEACAADFRVSRVEAEPILIGPLVQYAIIGMAFKSLSSILHDSLPSASACRSVAQDIRGIGLATSYLDAVKGERASGVAIFDQVRGSRDPVKTAIGLAGQPEKTQVPTQHSPAFVRWWLVLRQD